MKLTTLASLFIFIRKSPKFTGNTINMLTRVKLPLDLSGIAYEEHYIFYIFEEELQDFKWFQLEKKSQGQTFLKSLNYVNPRPRTFEKQSVHVCFYI